MEGVYAIGSHQGEIASETTKSENENISNGCSDPDSPKSLANSIHSASTVSLNARHDVIASYVLNYLASSSRDGRRPEVDAVTSALRLALYNGAKMIGNKSERLHRNDVSPSSLLPAYNSTSTSALVEESSAKNDVIRRRTSDRSSDAENHRGGYSGTKRSSSVSAPVVAPPRTVPWRPFVDEDDQEQHRSRPPRSGFEQEAFLDVVLDEKAIVRRLTVQRCVNDHVQRAHHQNHTAGCVQNPLQKRHLVQFGTEQTPKRLPSGNWSNENATSLRYQRPCPTYLVDAAPMRPVSDTLQSYPISKSGGQHQATSTTFWPRYAPYWHHQLSSSTASPLGSVTSSPGRQQMHLIVDTTGTTSNHVTSPFGSFQETPSSTTPHSSFSSSSSGSEIHSIVGHRPSSTSGTPTTTSSPLACCYCDKVYASAGALKMHIRTHTLPCRCPHCGKAFSRLWLLRGHLRTHTGERPFQCPDPGCCRAFADRSNLRAHLRTHSNERKTDAAGTGRQSAARYECITCGKSFSRISLMVKHELSAACCRREMMTSR